MFKRGYWGAGFEVLGGMSEGDPNLNLAPHVVLGLGNTPQVSAMLGLPRDKDEH